MIHFGGASIDGDADARGFLIPHRQYSQDHTPADMERSPELARLHSEHKARRERMTTLPERHEPKKPEPPAILPPTYLSVQAVRMPVAIVTGFWGYHSLSEDHGKITPTQIIRQVSQELHISVAEMKGRSRHAEIVHARQTAMYRIRRDCPHISLPRIGSYFGDRDHTTVLHAVRKMGALYGHILPEGNPQRRGKEG